MEKVTYILMGILLIGFVSSFPGVLNSETVAETIVGIEVEYLTTEIIIPCEDYCVDSAPFTTFCNEEDKCEAVKSSKDYYMASLNGQCQNLDNKEDCYIWWNHYYEERENKYFIIIIILVFSIILILYKKKKV